MEADGVPTIAEGIAFDRIADRLVELSSALGTDVRSATQSSWSLSARRSRSRQKSVRALGRPP